MEVPPGLDLTESKAPNIIAAVTVLWAGGLLFVGLRLWARKVAKAPLGLDDWLVVFAAVPFSATCIANYIGVHYGAGRHLLAVIMEDPSNVQKFLKYIYAVEIGYPFVIGPVKCSICCLYIRIFGVNKPFRWACLVLIITTALWGIGLLLGTIFQCTPVKDAWHPTGDRSNCVDLRDFLVGTNVPNIAIDFMILFAPIQPIWKLHLPTKKKILISSILMLGAGECAFSIVRLAKLVNLNTADATWDYFDAIVWSTVEQAVAIICVSLPVLGPLLPRVVIGKGTTSQGSQSYNRKDSSYALSSTDQKFSKLENNSTGDHVQHKGDIYRTTEFQVTYHDADSQ